MSETQSSSLSEACAKVVSETMESITCMLQKGIITLTEFNTFIAAKLTVHGISTDDGAGNVTVTITVENTP